MTSRVLMGDFGGGDYRMRMSKPGFDVAGALDPERLAFDSAWPDAGIIYTKGTVAVASGFTATVNFADTLPAVPYVIYWWKVSGTIIRVGTDSSTNTANFYPYFATVSTTGITFWPNQSFNMTAYTAGYVVLRPL